ncbi:MAG: hypothetical protein AVDCRST_MAG69-706, partial [uncultured Solirubrobacteraceae bacterium]
AARRTPGVGGAGPPGGGSACRVPARRATRRPAAADLRSGHQRHPARRRPSRRARAPACHGEGRLDPRRGPRPRRRLRLAPPGAATRVQLGSRPLPGRRARRRLGRLRLPEHLRLVRAQL